MEAIKSVGVSLLFTTSRLNVVSKEKPSLSSAKIVTDWFAAVSKSKDSSNRREEPSIANKGVSA